MRYSNPAQDVTSAAIEEIKKIEEETASRNIQKQAQRVLIDALRTLPDEDYLWFDISPRPGTKGVLSPGSRRATA